MSAGLSERVEALRAAGAARFDGPGFRFVEGLLRRAEQMEGAPAAHLRRRTAQRLDRLEQAFARAREDARVALEAVQSSEGDPDGALAAAFESGDFARVRQEAPGALRAATDGEARAARARLSRLRAQAEGRGVTLPTQLRLQLADADAAAAPDLRRLGDALARALFREAADDARSTVVVARAADGVPAETGPYNPQALAAEALALGEAISPTWLRARLRGLEDLAALRLLPAPKKRRR